MPCSRRPVLLDKQLVLLACTEHHVGAAEPHRSVVPVEAVVERAVARLERGVTDSALEALLVN